MEKTILSQRAFKALKVLAKNNKLVSPEEASRYKQGELELVDDIYVLKTHVPGSQETEILSTTVNKDPRVGINDFDRGVLSRADEGGTFVADRVRISHATGVKADDVATKNFTQTSMPAELENAVLRVYQGGRIIREIKVSTFALKGDETQTVNGGWLFLDHQLVLVAGSPITMKLVKPENMGAYNEGFFSVEFDGLKTAPKRTRR